MPTRPTAYRTRQARAETIGTFSNELGIAIAAPFRKALSEPHGTDYIAVTANSEAQNHRLGGRRERFWPLGAQKRVQQGVTHPRTMSDHCMFMKKFLDDDFIILLL